MGKLYNEAAGHSLSRLAALSDGIFAVAMTLLVLDLHIPLSGNISEHDLWEKLLPLGGTLLAYFMSFLTLGIFWLGQQTQLNLLARSDRNLTWIHIGFLLWVALMPGSTALLAAFIDLRIALIGYWLNILILGALMYWGWAYARRAGLVKEAAPEGIDAAIRRRIVTAQLLYALGAALCVFSTHWSIAFIVLVQLNYVIAPQVRWLRHL